MNMGNSLAVQLLGLCAFTVKGWGSILGGGTKIPQAVQHGQKKKAMNTRYFFIFIYLFIFIWLHRVLVVACELLVAACMWDLVP